MVKICTTLLASRHYKFCLENMESFTGKSCKKLNSISPKFMKGVGSTPDGCMKASFASPVTIVSS